MKEKSEISVDKEIAVEACAWFAQLETGDMTAADMSALREWMARSPAHAEEIRAVAGLSGQLAVLTELAEPLAAVSGANSPLMRKRYLFADLSRVLMITAVLALAGLVGLLTFDFTDKPPVVYLTGVGEYDTIELADGSEVRLNTNSLIE